MAAIFRTDEHHYRTELNNYLQVNGGCDRLRWEETQTGLQHKLTWTAICYIDNTEYARASSPSLAQAKEAAAHIAHRALSFQPFRQRAGLTVTA